MSKVIFEDLSAVISALICFNSGILFSMVFNFSRAGNYLYELMRSLVSSRRQLPAVLSELSELNTVIISNNLKEVVWGNYNRIKINDYIGWCGRSPIDDFHVTSSPPRWWT